MKGEFFMKALKSVQISLIFVLLLGLLVAWTATVPQQISGDRLLGAAIGCACDDYSELDFCRLYPSRCLTEIIQQHIL
jgi:hypothetical protein